MADVRHTRTVIDLSGCLPPLWLLALPVVVIIVGLIAQAVIYG